MQPLVHLNTTACPLAIASVDTDQLIPARFMSAPRSEGYGQYLLYDLCYDAEGNQLPFILNQEGASSSQVLVTRRNFGAGSSREAAVYCLVDFGFRCVIAPSFGDIFSSNSINNGLLPAVVSEEDCERLLSYLDGQILPIEVDLESQQIRAGELVVPFSINPTWRTKLLNGWDDIDLTRARSADITEFAGAYLKRYPWMA